MALGISIIPPPIFLALFLPPGVTSAVCSGKVTPGGKKKRTKKAYGGLVGVEDMTKSVIV